MVKLSCIKYGMKRSKIITHTKYRIADTLKLPRDLSRGESLLSVTGHNELFIENYQGILECNNQNVVIATRDGRVQVLGNELKVSYYTDEEMKIKGSIYQIVFL